MKWHAELESFQADNTGLSAPAGNSFSPTDLGAKPTALLQVRHWALIA